MEVLYMHPELVYLAASKAGRPLMQIIFDAYQYNEIHISKRRLLQVHNSIVNHGEVPPVVEDYAIQYLAGKTKCQLNFTFFSEVPKDYNDWIKYSKRRNL